MSLAKKKILINEEIRAPQVRLIAADGKQIGIISLKEALHQAEQAELDLVEISPDANPPVCRVMDFGKYEFEQKKLKAQQRKKQKNVQTKELKFRPTTEIGDYQIKLRKLLEFLAEGHKVKVTVRFKGRELLYQELGFNLTERIEKDVAEQGIVEQRPKLEARQLMMLIAPRKK
ncbi:MAG: translation initiation factor IF-3 [Gammaproteobacteria bacterium]